MSTVLQRERPEAEVQRVEQKPLDFVIKEQVFQALGKAGVVTLRQLVLQAIKHVRHHLPFIDEKRAALLDLST